MNMIKKLVIIPALSLVTYVSIHARIELPHNTPVVESLYGSPNFFPIQQEETGEPESDNRLTPTDPTVRDTPIPEALFDEDEFDDDYESRAIDLRNRSRDMQNELLVPGLATQERLALLERITVVGTDVAALQTEITESETPDENALNIIAAIEQNIQNIRNREHNQTVDNHTTVTVPVIPAQTILAMLINVADQSNTV